MSIDWGTLGLQTVNVLILVWLLRRFFWTPLAALIAQRQKTVQGALAEAETKRRQAQEELAGIARVRDGLAQERETILNAARVEAMQIQADRLAQADRQAQAEVAASRARTDAERSAAAASWRQGAAALAVDIAARLAARLDGAAVRSAFLEWLVKEIQTLPAPLRQTVAEGNTPLDIISAVALPPVEQETCRTRIAQAFGGAPPIGFKVDPALIAGLELMGRDLLMRNSWRADLQRTLDEITNEAGH
jgi:F-type H+-transporting ATPase subunit b